jgi:Flp pilus assembly pilin Flp
MDVIKNFLEDESGIETMEYAIIVPVLVLLRWRDEGV